MHSLEVLKDLAMIFSLSISSPLHHPFEPVVHLPHRVHQGPYNALQTLFCDDVLVSQPVDLISELG